MQTELVVRAERGVVRSVSKNMIAKSKFSTREVALLVRLTGLREIEALSQT
jgi:hypothetical protein